MKLWNVLENSAETWPDRVAVVDEKESITFFELRERALALAQYLSAQGLQAKQGFGIRTHNGYQFLVALFAGFHLEAVVLPLSHQLRAFELSSMLSEVPLRMILDDGSGCEIEEATSCSEIDKTSQFQGRLWSFDQNVQPFCDHIPDAACARFTSGTTGNAKGVILSHQSVLDRTWAAQSAFQLTPDDTVLWVLPMAHHFVVTLIKYVRYGVKIAVSKDMLAQSIIDCATRHHATFLYAAPMHYRLLAASPYERKMPDLRLAVSTSASLSPVVAKQFAERYELPVRQVYGIIELGIPAGDLSGDDLQSASVGKMLPGFEVGVLDAELRALPQGEVGKLAMRGPGMFDGYLRPSVLRDEILQNGWFLTGDLASIDSSGRIFIEGREKSMINVSGNKVFPEEVELVLNTFEGVQESRVFSEKHPIMGEIVIAEVVPEKNVNLRTGDLRRHCRDKLSAYKLPHDIRLVEHIARTVTGKVKRDLKKMDAVAHG